MKTQPEAFAPGAQFRHRVTGTLLSVKKDRALVCTCYIGQPATNYRHGWPRENTVVVRKSNLVHLP